MWFFLLTKKWVKNGTTQFTPQKFDEKIPTDQQWHCLKPVIFFLGAFFDDRSLVERRLTFFLIVAGEANSDSPVETC